MSECQLSENAIYKIIRQLRESGYIEREGGRKEGSWKVLKLQGLSIIKKIKSRKRTASKAGQMYLSL